VLSDVVISLGFYFFTLVIYRISFSS